MAFSIIFRLSKVKGLNEEDAATIYNEANTKCTWYINTDKRPYHDRVGSELYVYIQCIFDHDFTAAIASIINASD